MADQVRAEVIGFNDRLPAFVRDTVGIYVDEAERLARLETMDSGKPLGEAMEDIAEVAFMFEYYGGWATKVDGYIPPIGPDAMSLVV